MNQSTEDNTKGKGSEGNSTAEPNFAGEGDKSDILRGEESPLSNTPIPGAKPESTDVNDSQAPPSREEALERVRESASGDGNGDPASNEEKRQEKKV
ncbi:MAG: hypothetical protein JWQ27_2091 [Ferruginibacter sp.]|nr:hypothetical protein [Ferruginibacter sp.]